MKARFLLLLLCMPAMTKAVNVDSLRRATIEPIVNEYLYQAINLTYEIEHTPDITAIKQYSAELAALSNELKAIVKAFYPHSGGDLISTTTFGLGYTTVPCVGNMHPWESYADAIAQKANAVSYLCDRSPVKMQKKLDALNEQLLEMARL